MHLKPHKNITLKRLSLDLYQFIRSQSFAVKVLGRQFQMLPAADEEIIDQMRQLCGLCGHFSFARPVKTEKISRTWQRAYVGHRSKSQQLTTG
jgi:hypothetical protein